MILNIVCIKTFQRCFFQAQNSCRRNFILKQAKSIDQGLSVFPTKYLRWSNWKVFTLLSTYIDRQKTSQSHEDHKFVFACLTALWKKAFNAGSRLIQSERRGWPPWPEERASFLWATLYANSLFDHKKIDLLLLYMHSAVSGLLIFFDYAENFLEIRFFFLFPLFIRSMVYSRGLFCVLFWIFGMSTGYSFSEGIVMLKKVLIKFYPTWQRTER